MTGRSPAIPSRCTTAPPWCLEHSAHATTGRYLATSSFISSGSGGAGPTILATSFLLLGEDVIAYNKGEEIKLKPYSGVLNIDFGKGVRKKNVYLLNLPEVKSTFKILGVPTVSARFGAAPFFWKW